MQGFHRPRPTLGEAAFTLLELLVSATVVLLLVGMVLLISSGVGSTISRASSRLDAFTTARAAFDLVMQRLGQATLNPYYDYLDNQGRARSDPYYRNGAPSPFVPARYGRQSDLQFLVRGNVQYPGCGQEVYFVSPLVCAATPDTRATTGLINAAGFFVHYGSDGDFLPATIATPHARYRLMQAVQATARLSAFASVAQNDLGWITDIGNAADRTGRCVSPLADNVLALTVWPRFSGNEDPTGSRLTANYLYDSRLTPAADPAGQPDTANQLPPVVQVTMVVVSEASAARLAGTPAQPPAALADALLNAGGQPKFAVSTATQHQADLDDLSARLTRQGVSFEVFTTAVPMHEPRWGLHPATTP